MLQKQLHQQAKKQAQTDKNFIGSFLNVSFAIPFQSAKIFVELGRV